MDTCKDINQRYKQCAGKGCTKKGIVCLRIRYINKLGWFCDSCKDSLVREGLIEAFEEEPALPH